ncbi:MAG: YbjN domain-containing protein [Pseudomonadota bacterium]
MTSLRVESDNILSNPLDMIEQIIIERDWAYDRPNDEEIVAEVTSSWCNYRIWFSWQSEQGALAFSCSFGNKIPTLAFTRIYSLLAQVNDKLWLGHFDLTSEDNAVAFRHGMLLRGGCVISMEQVEDLIDIAVAECERFYPAFQSVIWGNKSADEALAAAIFETVGEA